MSSDIIVAIFSLCGTLGGSALGVIAASRLTNYRIDRIEERLNAMDALDKRVSALETHNQVQDVKIESIERETRRNSDDIKGME